MEPFIFEIPSNQINNYNNIVNEKKVKIAENIYKLDDIDENNEVDNIGNITNKTNKKNSICFATMCKNEENCIRDKLENVYKHIDYWVVSDTGSTDNTCKIIEDFFREKNIPGELHHDEWVSFDINKTKLFDYCYKKTDYILHLDADHLLEGEFEFREEDAGKLKYHCLCKRGNTSSITFQVIFMYNNNYHWKFCGVAHTTIRCLDNYNLLDDGYLTDRNFYLNSRDNGNRSLDSEKYYKDALLLKEQFFNTLLDDPDGLNSRSVFYTAQSYYDSHKHEDAAKWYSLYTKLKDTWIEETFESYLRLGLLYRILKYDRIHIIKMYMNAINIFNDRAEPYLQLGTYYNQIGEYQEAYNLLFKAKTFSYDIIKNKYMLFVNDKTYGKYLNDELSVACYWIGDFFTSRKLIEEIIDDPDFSEHRERLQKNLQYTLDRIDELNELNQSDKNKIGLSKINEENKLQKEKDNQIDINNKNIQEECLYEDNPLIINI